MTDRCVDGTGEGGDWRRRPAYTDKDRGKQTTQTRHKGRGNREENKGQTLQILMYVDLQAMVETKQCATAQYRFLDLLVIKSPVIRSHWPSKMGHIQAQLC